MSPESHARKILVCIWIAVAPMVASCLPTSALAQRVFAEGGIASTLAGAGPRGRPIYRKLYFIAIGPEDLGDDHERFRACVKSTIVAVAEAPLSWKYLDEEVIGIPEYVSTLAKIRQPLTSEGLQSVQRGNRALLGKHFIKIREEVRTRLRMCPGFPARWLDSLRYGVVNRVCTGENAASCGQWPDNYDRAQFQRYAKVYDWFQFAGVHSANEIVELTATGLGGAITVRYERDPQNPWPAQPREDGVQRAFERAVVALRKRNEHFSYVAPIAIGIRKQTGERLLDVIDHPVLGVPPLRSFDNPAQAALLTLDDEIGRSRILQCVVFQAKNTADKVSKCAGYKLDETSLTSCLTGQKCLPEYEVDAALDALEIVSPRSLRDLAAATLPRLVPPEAMKLQEYQRLAQDCANRSATPALAAVCLTEATAPEHAKRTLKCAQNAASSNKVGRRAAEDCLLESLDASERELLGCVRQQKSSSYGLVTCLAESSLDENQRRVAACVQERLRAGDQPGALRCSVGAIDRRAQKLLDCREKHRDNYQAVSLCMLEDEGLPEHTSDAVECAQQNSADLQRFGGCLFARSLLDGRIGGDLGRGLGCVARSGGSYVGSLTCIAGPKVEPEQQIALECLSQSADALSYAGCVGGRLTLKELGQCKSKAYGESGCYGDNNEIRKFLDAFGINAGPKTLVGRIAGHHVKVATMQLAFAESAASDAFKVAEEVVNFAGGAIKAVSELAENIIELGSQPLNTVRKFFGL